MTTGENDCVVTGVVTAAERTEEEDRGGAWPPPDWPLQYPRDLVPRKLPLLLSAPASVEHVVGDWELFRKVKVIGKVELMDLLLAATPDRCRCSGCRTDWR